jgi:hypothetical protein
MATRTITLTDIPDAVYERLREDAEDYGLSIAELVRRDLIDRTPTGKRLSWDELSELIAQDEPLDLTPDDIVEALHAGRAERY